MPNIALLTDFGNRDWYVGSMKGVIASICPQANLIDVSHHIPPGDARSGSFVLEQCWQDFPVDTVFLGVVDPGVGTQRKPIAIRSYQRLFVGPDNGLFSFLNNTHPEIHEINNTHLFASNTPSNTFHGRDIFAPVAAHLANGTGLSEVGPILPHMELIHSISIEFGTDELASEIAYIDHYGNCITRLDQNTLERHFNGPQYVIKVSGLEVPIADTYGDVPEGAHFAYFGSNGFLEIGVRGDSAAEMLALEIGQRIRAVQDPSKVRKFRQPRMFPKQT